VKHGALKIKQQINRPRVQIQYQDLQFHKPPETIETAQYMKHAWTD